MDAEVIRHAQNLKASLDQAQGQADAAGQAVANPQHGFLLNILQTALQAFLEQLGKQGQT